MTRLQGLVNRRMNDVRKSANAMFAFQKNEMAKAIKTHQQNIIKILAYHLATMPQVNYGFYLSSKLDKTIQGELADQGRVTSARIKPIWTKLTRDLHLVGRLAGGYLSRISQPPWKPVKLDLESPYEKEIKWENSLPYYFKRLDSQIMDQLHLGIKNEESVTEIMKRIKTVFGSNKLMREGSTTIKKDSQGNTVYTDKDTGDQQIASDVFDEPLTQVTTGTYSDEDVANLQTDQRAAMDWFSREYSPSMDKAVWENNKFMMGLERDLMTDSVNGLHQGLLQIGSDNMGIQDFTWIASKGRNECENCRRRDNLTMTQIKDKFGSGAFTSGVYPPGLPKDSPPPLHPWCNCQLVPAINDDWADSSLKKDGYEWNPDTGLAFNPTAAQQKLGFTTMSWDDWLGSIGTDNGQRQAN